jgi:hypothetical protein
MSAVGGQVLAPGQEQRMVELRAVGSVQQLVAAISASDVGDHQRCEADVELHMLRRHLRISMGLVH